MKQLLWVLLLVATPIIAQERVGAELPKISKTIKGELKKATGWMLTPEDQWVSRPNRIPVFLEHAFFKDLVDYEKSGLGYDNFTSYQLRDLKYKDQDFTILIKTYKSGSYKYEAIKEGWRKHTGRDYYIFKTSELDKLTHLNQGKENIIPIDLVSFNGVYWIDEPTLIADIETESIKQIKEWEAGKSVNSDIKLYLHIAPYKSKNIVQFQIYGYSMTTAFTMGIIDEFDTKSDYSKLGSDKLDHIYTTDKLFKKAYYETDYKSFVKFLPIE